MIKNIEGVIKFLERHVVLRFVASGSIGAVVDLVALYVLYDVFGFYYLFSAILAFLIAFCVSFTLHKFWTFKSNVGKTKKQIATYLGTSLVGFTLNTLLMYVFVDLLDIAVLLSQVFVGAIVASCSFFLSRNFVFKYKEVTDSIS